MRMIALCMVVLAFFIFATSSFAEDITGRWALGSRYNYVVVDDADFKNNGNSYGLNFTYGISKHFALELEGDFFKVESKDNTKLVTYTLHSNMQLRKDVGVFTPYLVGGLGIQYFDYGILKVDDRKDKDVSFSYKLGGGIEYFCDQNWALNIEGAYVYGNTGGSATLDVYGWRYGGGVKYYF
ncbi:MAG TPA: porin family protein [Candidatus Omnitrophica bacterium]|nr:porin family protein [Candidatus Omnitrophota bacterium]